MFSQELLSCLSALQLMQLRENLIREKWALQQKIDEVNLAISSKDPNEIGQAKSNIHTDV